MTKKNMSIACLVFSLTLLIATAPSLMSQPAQDQQARQTSATAAATAQTQADQTSVEAKRKIEREAQKALEEVVIKTYTLKYVSPSEILKVARPFIFNSTGNRNIMTVQLQKKYIPEFETLLKKLDVEKKNILFQVYTIIASKEMFRQGLYPPDRKPNQEIENHDLNRAMTELKSLWNFKYYLVDDPSFLTVKDGAESSAFRLVSKFGDFDMNLLNIQITGDEPGKRTIDSGQLVLRQKGMQGYATLIDTKDISFKEKGFLVVGVSGLEEYYRGYALILVMSAEIK